MINKILSSKIWWLALSILTAGLIYLSTFLSGRLDLTAEQRFTVSKPARQLLGQLEEPMNITVLLQGEKMPSGFKKLQNSTASFLDNCRRYSHNHVTYSFVDAETFVNDSIRFPIEKAAKGEWVRANAVMQNEIDKGGTRAMFNYPIALIEYKGEYAQVNFLQGLGNKSFFNPNEPALPFETINKAEEQLEYNFVAAMQSIMRQEVPMIAYAMGNGEPDGPETYDLRQTLKSKYRFYLLNLQQQPYVSDSIKVLLVVKPSIGFNDAEKLKLDQYIMHGGNVLFLMDALNADMDSLVRTGKDFTAFSRDLRVDDLLFRYGARINNDLVQDKQSDILPMAVGSMGGQPQIELLNWTYFPFLYSTSNHPVSKNLDAVVMQFPNSVDTVQVPGIHKEILLSTSNTSRLTGAPVIVSVEELKRLEKANDYKQNNIPVAVLLEGKFKSLYANRLTPAMSDSLKANGQEYLSGANAEGKILVTGDGDWVLNGFNKKGPLEMGTNPYLARYAEAMNQEPPRFANKDFLLNALEYLTDESGIMASRSRQFTLRLLDPKRLETEKTSWQWLNIGLPILLILLAGILFNWQRQRRYSS